MGEDKEYLVQYTKEYLTTHPNIDYFTSIHLYCSPTTCYLIRNL